MAKRSPNYAVPALEKGLLILETLAGSPEPVTLTGLARALGRGSNEIFRMVNFLEEKRYILRDAAGGYRLSLRLFGLAYAKNPVLSLIRAAEPEMRKLSAESGESCHLCTLEGGELIVLSRMEGPGPVRLVVEVGRRFPAVGTASGRMLLAGLGEEDRMRLLGNDPAFNAMSKAAQRLLTAKLDQIRQTGISTAMNETINGVVDAAVAIGLPGTPLHASLAISALSSSRDAPDPMQFAVVLQSCADTINRAFGLYLDGK